MRPVRAALLLAALALTGCNQNQVARSLGGTANYDLEPGRKFVDAYWDGENHLWIVTRAFREGERPETFVMEEKSAFGVVQGKVVIVEHGR